MAHAERDPLGDGGWSYSPAPNENESVSAAAQEPDAARPPHQPDVDAFTAAEPAAKTAQPRRLDGASAPAPKHAMAAVFGPLDSPAAHTRPTDLAQPRFWSHEYPYLDHPDITDAQDGGAAFLPVRSLLLDDRRPLVLSPGWHAHVGTFAGGAWETNVHRSTGAGQSAFWLGIGADFGVETRPPGEAQGNFERPLDFAVHASALTRIGTVGTFPALAVDSRLVLRPLGVTTFVVDNAFRYASTPGFTKDAASGPATPSLITYDDHLLLALRHRFNDMMTMTTFYQLDAQLVDTLALQGKTSLHNRLLCTFGVDAEQVVARVEAKLYVEGGYRTSPLFTSLTPPDAFPLRAGAFANITLPRQMIVGLSLAFQDLFVRTNANYPDAGTKPLRFAGSFLIGWTPPRGTISAYLEWLGEPAVIGTGRYRVESGIDARLRFGNAIAAGRLAYRRLDYGTALGPDAQAPDVQRIDHEYSLAAQLRWNPAGLGHIIGEYDLTLNLSNCRFTDETVATLAPCGYARHMLYLRIGFGM